MNKKQFGVTLILVLLMVVLLTGENLFNGNIKKVALTNNNIEGLSTYKALDGLLTYKLPDSWDVEEKRYPGNYIIYDNSFISDTMGLWGYVQILNSSDDLKSVVNKEKEIIDKNEISNYSVSDENINNDLVKKVSFKEKGSKGVTYFNTVYYKRLGENKIIKVLFSASENKQKEDYSIIYKSIIDSIVHKN